MKYYIIQPPKRLTKFVRYYWVLEGQAALNKPYIHRSMADGCAELLFHYYGCFDEINSKGKNEKSFKAGLSGQSQIFRRFTVNQNFGIFGVYLYPYAIKSLFSIQPGDAKNQMLDIKDVLGQEAQELEEKIMEAPDNGTRVNIVNQFFETKLLQSKGESPGIFEAINYIIQTKGTIPISTLANKNFLSERQFERKFKDSSGFTPKLFSRIIRFQSVLEQYGQSGIPMTEIAYNMGYYDQSHFIGEFKEFSGLNPLNYFTGKTEATEWKD